MFEEIAHKAEDAASHAVQTAALGAGAAIGLIVGAFFLTLSAWLFLVAVASAAVAALILGGLYAGIGLILFAVISVKSRKRQRRLERQAALRAASNKSVISEIIAAFMTGLTAGRKTRS